MNINIILKQVSSLMCILLLAGCGTIAARATTENPQPYAGLRLDAVALDGLYSQKGRDEMGGSWLVGVPLVSAIIVADMASSAAFDTYCLPWDLARRGKPMKGTNLQGAPMEKATPAIDYSVPEVEADESSVPAE